MANTTTTILKTIKMPTWTQEVISPSQNFLKDFLRSIALFKVQDYKKRMAVYENKYNSSFEKFEKKIKKAKRENFEHWDDYIIWEVLFYGHQKWLKRYQELCIL